MMLLQLLMQNVRKMTYEVRISRKLLKILEKINEPDYTKIKEAIYGLAENPRPFGYKQLKGSTTFRIRVGNYRIIYDIYDDVLVVQIVNIGHRKKIYD